MLHIDCVRIRDHVSLALVSVPQHPVYECPADDDAAGCVSAPCAVDESSTTQSDTGETTMHTSKYVLTCLSLPTRQRGKIQRGYLQTIGRARSPRSNGATRVWRIGDGCLGGLHRARRAVCRGPCVLPVVSRQVHRQENLSRLGVLMCAWRSRRPARKTKAHGGEGSTAYYRALYIYTRSCCAVRYSSANYISSTYKHWY